MVRRHIDFYGNVQGVGFRYFAINKCRQLGLTGWVENKWDGSVEMEVQGDTRLIDEMIEFVGRQGYISIDRMVDKNIPLEEHEYNFEKRGLY